MHNNYYFFTHLTNALQKKLSGSFLFLCLSQNKNELVFGFKHHKKEEFYIKASLQPDFPCLSFPAAFKKAKRNYVELFPDIINKNVTGIRQFENERAFSILFQDDYNLLFKMFGNFSNILVFQHLIFKDMFVHKRSKDAQISLSELDRPIDQSKDALIKNDWDIKTVYPTFNLRMINHLKTVQQDNDDVWSKVQIFLREINNGAFYICLSEKTIVLTMYKTGEVLNTSTNSIDILNKFYQICSHKISFEKEKIKISNTLDRQRKKLEGYIKTTSGKLRNIVSATPNNHIGDIIMANLNTITPGTKSVDMLNFYTNENIKITLNPKLSPQLNAEQYYRKAERHDQEIRRLADTISEKKKHLMDIQDQLEAIASSQNLKEIKALPVKTDSRQIKPSIPFKEVLVDGYHIYIGKNARRNDDLTFRIAKKDDMFLHVKDATGSHVIVKQHPGKVFPKYIISKAAQFAAHYSKRKNENLCAVIYTLKKYVRKKKGAPAGTVIVEKEKVLLVTPSCEL